MPNPNDIAIPGSTRKIMSNARLVQKSNASQLIKVSFYVRKNPNPPASAVNAVEAIRTQLPGERRAVTDAEFNSVFGADPADLELVAKWAAAHQLKVVNRSVPKRRLLLEGSIGNFEKALNIQLNEYSHPDYGDFRGREGKLYVAPELAGVVEGVFGLDNRPIGSPRRRRIEGRIAPWKNHKAARGTTAPHASAANPFPGNFFPPQVATLYQYPAALDGTGQNIAIFAFNGPPSPDPRGGYSITALNNYFEQVLGGQTPSITDVVIQGPGNDPGPDTTASSNRGDTTGEVMLDMCVVGSVAPKAKIFMYFTEFSSQGWVEAINEAITGDNNISVISISYGNPEDDPDGLWTAMGVQQVNQAFEAAIAKQITICVAAGDDGSSDGEPTGVHVDFPASSPNVLGVGGTKLTATSGQPPAILREVVWNEVQKKLGATGGGISAVFAKPDYQNSVTVPVSAGTGHAVGRGVPDVAAVGDPLTGVIVMHIDGKNLEPIGGTSASTPLWAALVARLNQGMGARCGFINPILYSKFSHGVLNDIISGNNGAYAAGAGWDACTGLGSPNGQRLLTAFSSASAPVQKASAPAT
ncbi:MAG TPA: S53 family peptidase [Verrucomicrobiae bacterium]|nr:S53 family peptidase [Verrucomicrobiae bacterium]